MPLWRGGPNTRTLPTVLITPSANKAADMAHLCVPQNQALGVCRGFVPDIQICGTHGRKDLVNTTIISNAEEEGEEEFHQDKTCESVDQPNLNWLIYSPWLPLFTLTGTRLLWAYCPGHSRVRGNGQASVDSLASRANITTGLQLGCTGVLWGLMNCLSKDLSDLLSTDYLKERGMWKKNNRASIIKEWSDQCSARPILDQFSRQPLGRC